MRVRFFLALFCLVIPALFCGQSLVVGSTAPPISVKKWIKGTPIKSFEKEKIYVVEFWATWCGPCVTAIPHLTKLAQTHKDVTFVGVSVWEENKKSEVEKFVKEMGAKMEYNVAYSGDKDGMANTWLKAANIKGIPASFVIKNNKVAWIGHPLQLDLVLPKLKAGDIDKKESQKLEQSENAESLKVAFMFMNIDQKYQSGKTSEAKQLLAKAASDYADNEQALLLIRSLTFKFLAQEDYPAFEQKLIAGYKTKDQSQNYSAIVTLMMLSEKQKTAPIALKAVEVCLQYIPDESYFENILVLNIYENAKDYKKALHHAEKMILDFDLFKMSEETGSLEELKRRRLEFKKKLKS